MWYRTPLFVMLNNHLRHYPTPVNLDWSWNWNSLAGVCLVARIVTDSNLAMSYNGAQNKRNNVALDNTNALVARSPIVFEQWFAGFVDGDGCFTLHQKTNGSWAFELTVRQHRYNRQVLEHIKGMLGVGAILRRWSQDNMLTYSITHRRVLLEVVVPIFEQFPLCTRKQYQFELFRAALLEPSRCAEYKARWHEFPDNYRSPGFPTKSWIVGFVEAEGSFCVSRNGQKFVHKFSINQKFDGHLLWYIGFVLNITARVSNYSGCYQLTTGSKLSLEIIMSYFNGMLVGMKNYELIYWADSYRNFRADVTQMAAVQNKMRAMRASFDLYPADYRKLHGTYQSQLDTKAPHAVVLSQPRKR